MLPRIWSPDEDTLLLLFRSDGEVVKEDNELAELLPENVGFHFTNRTSIAT